MNLKKILFIAIIIFSTLNLSSTEPAASYKLYGFVRSDWYYNSRQNVEALDGLFNILPKPKDINVLTDEDLNAIPNSEMLAVSSRLGLDFTGAAVFNAKTSAKIECDFAGISTSYYLIRIRQAYLKLNWKKSELLVGQTWHPMYNNCQPVTPALSVGTPFQPFNRSPQIRFKHNLNDNFSYQTAASYQMQYLSQGPNGTSASYMKNGLLPSLHIALDYKSKDFGAGVGLDGKSLLINKERLNSAATVAYARYSKNKFQIRAKTVYGQNLSEYLMIGGYGVKGTRKISDLNYVNTYTNLNTVTSWLSLAYGSKIQLGIYGGISKNLGTGEELSATLGNFTAYGYGFYQGSQMQLDQLYRISPHITYNLPNFKLAFEYELTNAKYGKLLKNGLVENPYNVENHRLMASISYIF